MSYKNKAGNVISDEQYAAMKPTSEEGRKVKAGYTKVKGSTKAPTKG